MHYTQKQLVGRNVQHVLRKCGDYETAGGCSGKTWWWSVARCGQWNLKALDRHITALWRRDFGDFTICELVSGAFCTNET